MQGADEGRSREKVSWPSVNAADTSLEVRDEVAASSRAELKEVVMSSAEQRNNIVIYISLRKLSGSQVASLPVGGREFY